MLYGGNLCACTSTVCFPLLAMASLLGGWRCLCMCLQPRSCDRSLLLLEVGLLLEEKLLKLPNLSPLFIFFPIYNVNLSGKKLKKCLFKGNKAKQTVLCCPVSGGKGSPIVVRGKTQMFVCPEKLPGCERWVIPTPLPSLPRS